MSEDNEIRFDRQVREMLGDAQEKVPAGVWKGVRSELEGQRAAMWWRRAGLALAAAAVVLGIILFTREEDHSVPAPVAEIPAENLQQSTPLQESTMPEEVQTVPSVMPVTRAARTTGHNLIAAAAPAEIAGMDDSLAGATSDTAGMDDAQESAAATETSPTEARVYSSHVKEDAPAAQGTAPAAWEDPFAEKTSSTKTSRGASIELKGAFAANKNSIKFASRGIMGSPSLITTGIEQTSESTYGIPFSAGIGARWYLSDRFSLGTGVSYSLLTRKFTGNFLAPQSSGASSVKDADISHSLSYIGIPVNAYFDLIRHDPVGLYIFAGGEAERAIANNYNISKSGTVQTYSENVSGLQWSAQIGFGVTFKLTDFMSLYADPSLKFYFNGAQPQSVRTQQPLMFNAEIGLRFDLKK